MTPRSFWAILIKILGIYIIIDTVASIPQFLGTIAFFLNQPEDKYGRSGALIATAYIIFAFAAYGLILWCTLFKTDWIIDKLKLDQGFADERFDFTMHRSAILKIAITVMGGLILVDSLPILCRDIFTYYQDANTYNGFKKNPQTSYLILYCLKTLLGYFMLTCSRMIVNYIELKRRKPVMEQVEE